MNLQRLYERKNAKKIYGPVEEGECWKIITDDKIKYILKEKDSVKFIKFL
jgi:hypothetical protein